MFYRNSCLFLIILLSSFMCTKNPTETVVETNNKPEILSISADQMTIGMEQSTNLSVLAEDKDKDELNYNWSTNGGLYI